MPAINHARQGFSLDTPWGPAQTADHIGCGIMAVTTASHGGLFVPLDKLQHIPRKQQAWAKQWSGSDQWYEEDCCWAAVAVAFPECFSAKQIELAREMVANYVKR